MSECREIADRLTPFVDDVLPAEERARVDRHLQACPPCRQAADAEAGARAAVRQCAARLTPPLPPGLRSRCEAAARLNAHTSAGRAWWRARLVPLSIVAALILLTSAILFSFATRRSDAVLAAQLTVDHVKCFRLFASPDAAAVESSVMERLLAQRYGWNVHVPPSSASEGLTLIGARRCLYADGSIPHVMYRAAGQNVSLFMLRGVSRRAANLVTLGHRSRIWSQGDTTYVLVSSAGVGELSSVARYVMSATH